LVAISEHGTAKVFVCETKIKIGFDLPGKSTVFLCLLTDNSLGKTGGKSFAFREFFAFLLDFGWAIIKLWKNNALKRRIS